MGTDLLRLFPDQHAGAPCWHPRSEALACWRGRHIAETLVVLTTDGVETHAWPQEVASLAWSPDGGTLAVGRLKAAQVALWDLAKGKTRKVLRTVNRTVWQCEYAPAGDWIYAEATGPNLFELATGKRTCFAGGGGSVAFVDEPAQTPRTSIVALDVDGLYVKRTADASIVRRLTTERPFSCTVNSPAALVATMLRTSDGGYTVALRELATGELRGAPLVLPVAEGMFPWKPSVDFSADGSLVAIGRRHTVRVYATRSGALVHELALTDVPAHDEIVTVRVRPDGNQLAVATVDGQLWLATL